MLALVSAMSPCLAPAVEVFSSDKPAHFERAFAPEELPFDFFRGLLSR